MLDLHLKVSSSEVINFLLSFPEEIRVQQSIKMLEIGALVLSRVDSHRDVDYLNNKLTKVLDEVGQKFSSLELQFKNILAQSLDPAVAGNPLNKANELLILNSQTANMRFEEMLKFFQSWISKEVEKLQDHCFTLDKSIDPTNQNGYLAYLIKSISDFDENLNRQFLESNTESLLYKIQKVSSASFDTSSPVGQLIGSLKAEITSLRDAVMSLRGEKEIEEVSTIKGFYFEEIVYSALQEIAKPYGDLVEDVSKTVEVITQSKKGDFLYSLLDSNSRLVIDAKNYKKFSSLKAMLEYLKEAMKTREASFGILVAPDEESLQKQIGSWNFYEGDKIITTLDNLEITLKFAKYFLKTKSIKEDPGKIDLSSFKDKVEILQRKIKDISNIKTKLSKLSNGVTSSISELQGLLDQLKDDFSNSLNEFELFYSSNVVLSAPNI